MSIPFEDLPNVYEETFPGKRSPLPKSFHRPSDHTEPPQNLELFAVTKKDPRVCILMAASFCLRQLSSSEFTSIDIDSDDPYGADLRRLSLEIAEALQSFKL